MSSSSTIDATSKQTGPKSSEAMPTAASKRRRTATKQSKPKTTDAKQTSAERPEMEISEDEAKIFNKIMCHIQDCIDWDEWNGMGLIADDLVLQALADELELIAPKGFKQTFVER